MEILSADMLIGLLGGFGLSFSLWWLLNHYLVPNIAFAEELSRRPINYDGQPYRHQFAFKNIGKRAVINVRLKARLRIIDPKKRGSTIKNYYDIHLSNNELFQLKPGTMRFMSVNFHESKSLDARILDREINKKRKDMKLTLDDVFDVYPDASLFIELIATDIYSSATKVFESKSYCKGDVRNGIFRKGCLDVQPLRTRPA